MAGATMCAAGAAGPSGASGGGGAATAITGAPGSGAAGQVRSTWMAPPPASNPSSFFEYSMAGKCSGTGTFDQRRSL
eukprot:7429323-Pyramimonas_sp.AAC.1